MDRISAHDLAGSRLRKLLLRSLVLGAALVALALVAGCLTWLHASRQAMRAQALASARGVAQSLQKAIEIDLARLDGILGNAELIRQLEGSAHWNDERLVRRFRARLDAGTGLLALGLLDAEGRRIGLAQRTPVSGLAGIEQALHLALPEPGAQSLRVLSLAHLGAPSHAWVLVLGRRVVDGQGHDAGLAYGLLSSEHFQSLMESVALGRQGAISLRYLPSMQLLARRSAEGGAAPPEMIGTRALSEAFERALARNRDTGQFSGRTALDQVERDNVYARVPGQSLLVVVGVGTAEYLALWWQQVLQVMGLLLLTLAALGWVAWLIYRAWRREAGHALALARQGQRVQALLRTASDGTHVLDASGRLVEVGDTFLSLLGYARAELIGQPIATWLPGFGARHVAVWGRWLERHRSLRRETWYQRADGRRVPVELYASRVLIDGQVLVYCSASDMTQRRLLESQLQASTQRVRDLWDNAPCGYHVMDEQGRFLQVNATECAWLGQGADALVGGRHTLAEFMRAEDRPAFARLLARLAEQGRAEDIEFELRAPATQGAARRVSISVTADPADEGGALQLRTAMYDVTHMHALRQQLARVVKEQQVMLDTDLIGIVKLIDRQVVWMNQGTARIFGLGPQQLIGQPIRALYADEATFARIGEQAYAELRRHGRYRSEVQMRHRDGRVLWIKVFGTLLSTNQDESMWLLEDVTEARQLFDRIERLAYHDGLTGLPNRRLMTDRLEKAIAQAQRDQQCIGVCFLDLDGFKAVNDQHGHEAGDRLLCEIAQRLEQALRPGDTVCRTGGDEFVLILNPLAQPADHERVLARVLEQVRQPVALGPEQQVRVGASIGVSFYPLHGQGADVLLRQADQAMYQAKAAGRGRVCVSPLATPAAPESPDARGAEVEPAPLQA